MADPVVFTTGDHGARSRDKWNDLSARVQAVIDNTDAVLNAKIEVEGIQQTINDAVQDIEADRQAAEAAALTATQKADAFASQLATMSTQILAIQTVVAEHHAFGE